MGWAVDANVNTSYKNKEWRGGDYARGTVKIHNNKNCQSFGGDNGGTANYCENKNQ